MALAGSALALSSAACDFSFTQVCPDGRKIWGDNPKDCTVGAEVASMCHVVRDDCLTYNSNNTCATTKHNDFKAISCGTNATNACANFCKNGNLPTFPYVNCTSTPTTDPVPTDSAFCNMQASPGNYDISCTNTGRECLVVTGANTCLNESATLTSGTRNSQCLEGFTGPGINMCGSLYDSAGKPLAAGNSVTAATFAKHTGPCPTSGALTASDMMYGIPAGTSVPVAVAGQNMTLTTTGGHMVVTYACDNTGEFCHPYEVKEFWVGMNPRTINGQTFSNIYIANAGGQGFRTDGTLDPAGPGFRISASVNGVAGPTTFFRPTGKEKFTGSLKSAPYTFSGTFDFPVRYGTGGNTTAHITMNISGSSYSNSGSAGGTQISTGTTTAVGNFVADKDFSGGAIKTRTNVIDLTGAINPAPMELYQSQHYASPFTYTIPGFASGSSHLVRLHFAETNPLNNAPNKRKFSVAINGTSQISNLDLFATVGMNKAFIWECTLNADSSGRYVLSFTASLDSATISGIEIL
jgi:hypothetical protein